MSGKISLNAVVYGSWLQTRNAQGLSCEYRWQTNEKTHLREAFWCYNTVIGFDLKASFLPCAPQGAPPCTLRRHVGSERDGSGNSGSLRSASLLPSKLSFLPSALPLRDFGCCGFVCSEVLRLQWTAGIWASSRTRWSWCRRCARCHPQFAGLMVWAFRILPPDCVQLHPWCSFGASFLADVLFWSGILCPVFGWHVGSCARCQYLDLWDIIVQMLLSDITSFPASGDSLL